MRSDPLVSVVIPTYNRAHIVGEAIESVLSQTYENVEVIVVDDGSTDNTFESLSPLIPTIRLLRQENAGPSAARNRGIAAANGEFVAFLDSDDLWLPEKLARQMALMQSIPEPVPCCLCNIAMRWRDKECLSFDVAGLNPSLPEGIWLNVAEVLATRFLLFNQGIVVRKTVLENVGGFDENLRYLEDHALALRLSLEGPWAYIREPLVVWRESASSLYQETRGEERRVEQPLVKILEKHLAEIGADRRCRSLRRYVAYELHAARRRLRTAQYPEDLPWLSSLGLKLRQMAERYHRSLFIRSPWFPHMRVCSLNQSPYES